MATPRMRGKPSAKRTLRINPLHFIFGLSVIGFSLTLYNSISVYSGNGNHAQANRKDPQPDNQADVRLPPDQFVTNSDAHFGTDMPTARQDQTSEVTDEGSEGSDGDEILGNESSSKYKLPKGFQNVLHRAKQFQIRCDSQPLEDSEFIQPNDIDLPSFGIVNALESYVPQSEEESREWQCEVPPSTECNVERFSVIFLGYGDDRLHGVKTQITNMLGKYPYNEMVEEVILVWNNPKPLREAGKAGQILYNWSQNDKNPFNDQEPNRFRIFYPIELGFPSTLMNRYHPSIKPKSKALLYYDDDGPFYNFPAIKSNFELWKRNSDSQTGAMARAFTLSKRQQREKEDLLGGPNELNDRQFISHCRHKGDAIGYDYRYFENFHANMVLPSGSMIHRNYLCFIWHPALRELRKFVFEHLVHPDDMTVATIVSLISGRAPHPYSRRVPPPDRKLLEASPNSTSPEGMWRTKDWGKLRSIALNSVIAYFGAINSGSFGWCYKTEYHQQHKGRHVCQPEMAREGTLPWMEPGGYGNDICPSS